MTQFLIWFHVCEKQVGEPYTLESSNNVQCTWDIVATLGHPFLATISDWPLYPA